MEERGKPEMAVRNLNLSLLLNLAGINREGDRLINLYVHLSSIARYVN